MAENEARAVLAEKRTGWWRVWLETDGEVFSLHDLVLEAETADAARAEALRLAKPNVTVSSVEPSANPRIPADVAVAYIADAADWITDHLRHDAETLQAGEPLDATIEASAMLPDCFAPLYTPELIERLNETVEMVAGKLARYPDTYLASTAEELAAHALLNGAKDRLQEDVADGEGNAEVLAAAAETLDEIHDLAFEDWDVLMLFDRRFDGIEHSEIGDQLGVANLHPRDWFTPFRGDRD